MCLQFSDPPTTLPIIFLSKKQKFWVSSDFEENKKRMTQNVSKTLTKIENLVAEFLISKNGIPLESLNLLLDQLSGTALIR